MTTGEKLTNLRKKEGFTQEELADKLNVSRQAVSKWEQNQAFPETEKLVQLSKLYGVSLDYLLGTITENETQDSPLKQPIYQTKTFFTSMWSIGYGLLMLLLYIMPYLSVRGEVMGFTFTSNVNVYQLIFTGGLQIGNILILIAFLLMITQIVMGIILLFSNKKDIMRHRKIISIIEFGLWVLITVLFIGAVQPGMIFIVFFSLVNVIGLTKVEQNTLIYVNA